MITASAARVQLEELKRQRERELAKVGDLQAAPYLATLNSLDESTFNTLISTGKHDAFFYANSTITLMTGTIHTRATPILKQFLEAKGYTEVRVLYNKIIAHVPQQDSQSSGPPCDCPPPPCDATCDATCDALDDEAFEPLPASPWGSEGNSDVNYTLWCTRNQ